MYTRACASVCVCVCVLARNGILKTKFILDEQLQLIR